MTEKAERHSKQHLQNQGFFNISADIFLIFDDGKIPAEAEKWLRLYVKRHIKIAQGFKSPSPPQLRLIHITEKDVFAANVQDEFQTSEDGKQYFAELDQSERIQLRLHGLLAFLLFARQCPAIIITDNRGIKQLCAESEPDPHVQDLIDDAFIIFVTDEKGMQSAQKRQLHAVPWEDQSQEPVIERVFLFHKTRGIEGFSKATHEVRRKIVSYGKKPDTRKTHHPVLIIGESRTGKELIANALYEVSGLEEGKFTAVACGTFTQSLLLSEIFGYWPGAFTSSDSHGGMGLIESAAGGVLLVDDIDAAEDPKGLQGAFLRCLITDPPTYRRVGARPSKKPISETAATWLIFTLNKPIRDMIKSGEFREDFLFRFQRIIQSPPISARAQDIPQIAMWIWKNSRLEGRPLTIPALRYLRYLKSDWEANAGELQALLLLAHELLSENKLLTWTQAINQVMERGEDYLAWYENAPKGGESFEAEIFSAGNLLEAPRDPGKISELIACKFPEKPHELIGMLKEEIRNKPNMEFQIDVLKRVYHMDSREKVCENEFLEKRKSYEGYRCWYALGTHHKNDVENESSLVQLLKEVFSLKEASSFIATIGKEKVSGKIHCYKVLLFLALHPQNTMKRKEMSAILWDRKGRKPLTSFETHRDILIRLLGMGKEKSSLKKHETHENEQLVIEYVQNEWRIRLKTAAI
jgi:transcriptional regulator with AAA-type ATPase domain